MLNRRRIAAAAAAVAALAIAGPVAGANAQTIPSFVPGPAAIPSFGFGSFPGFVNLGPTGPYGPLGPHGPLGPGHVPTGWAAWNLGPSGPLGPGGPLGGHH
jgi:hypothetical protein